VVTLSAGIAAYHPGDATAVEELLEQADAALYRAKSAGRNRVAQYEDNTEAAAG
jgi:diguanylate cyclase (GGDEF)-like protein